MKFVLIIIVLSGSGGVSTEKIEGFSSRQDCLNAGTQYFDDTKEMSKNNQLSPKFDYACVEVK